MAKGMACEYRATHEFGDDGCCNLCFKAKLVAEKEQQAIDCPPVNLGVDVAVKGGDEPLPDFHVPELPTGWSGTITWNTTAWHTASTPAEQSARLMPLQELSQLQAQAALNVAQGRIDTALGPRIEELKRQYYPFTKAGVLEREAEEARHRFEAEKQRVCEHRALYLGKGEDEHTADCAQCGKFFDEVELDELMAERRHLEQLRLTASQRIAEALAPAMANALQALGPLDIHAARQDSLTGAVVCECGQTFADLGAFTLHRQQEGG